MSILTAQDLAKHYGAQDVFQGVSLAIARGDKIALVGPNGAGKTTLLRILLHLEEPSAGTVAMARGLRTGYLPQRPVLHSERTVYQEMLALFADLQQQQRDLHDLMAELAQQPDSAELLERYAQEELRFELAGGYDYERRIRQVLGGLGFGEDTYDWPIAVLSGGQITRVLLARLLLSEPDLLVLDEPTNYLDLAAIEWLESFLMSWPHSLVIVSHDRFFLDRVVDRVWELNHGRLEVFRGNYSHYARQRRERDERQMKEYRAQQEEIAKTEEFVRRFKAGQRSKEARGRETRLKRLERIAAPQHDRHIGLGLAADARSGDKVIISEGGLAIGYPSRPEEPDSDEDFVLFRSGPILVQRGDKVAFLGPNGTGKTTFLRTLLQEIPPLSGDLRLGASVRLGYLPQRQDWLDPELTVLEQILNVSDLLVEEARTLLGRFLFTGDDVFKRTGDLSGGERARVALAILTLQGANLLVLDEPTTHLDVASQEVLQDVLTSFDGTVLCVTHDRYLINGLATHVWDIRDGWLVQFEGDYAAYAAWRQQQPQEAAPESADKAEREEARRARRQDETRRRKQAEQLAMLEQRIAEGETALDRTTALLDEASAAQDAARVQELGVAYTALQEQLAADLAAWEQLAAEMPTDD
ncbi:MAG: ABC-F family ATP-binding cassette domain-containing protein [Anaerolineales bacterium]